MRSAPWIAAAGILVLILTYWNLKPERGAAASAAAGTASGETATEADTMDKEPETPSDPSGPGAAEEVIVPEADPMMVYDPTNGRVTDKRNGDTLASRTSDLKGMIFWISSKDNELLHTFHTEWKLVQHGTDRVMTFKVLSVEKGRLPYPGSLQFAENLSLEQFGRFLRAHPQSSAFNANKMVMIDRREKYRRAK